MSVIKAGLAKDVSDYIRADFAISQLAKSQACTVSEAAGWLLTRWPGPWLYVHDEHCTKLFRGLNEDEKRNLLQVMAGLKSPSHGWDKKVERVFFRKSDCRKWPERVGENLSCLRPEATNDLQLFGSDERPIEAAGYSDHPNWPPELDVALIAWTAVVNDTDGGSGSPRKRLEAYIEKHYPSLSTGKTGAVQRIATVANWEK